jgi:uncharacterized membrane protein YdjX (TVP38/TMEM64 family)
VGAAREGIGREGGIAGDKKGAVAPAPQKATPLLLPGTRHLARVAPGTSSSPLQLLLYQMFPHGASAPGESAAGAYVLGPPGYGIIGRGIRLFRTCPRFPRVKNRRPPAWGKLFASCLVLVAIAAAWRFTGLHDIVTPENAAGWARRIREMPGAPVLLVLSYTLAAALMFPRPLLTLTTVIAFGPWRGTIYCALGIMVAAMVFYYIGRFGPKGWVEKLAGDKTADLEKVMRRHGIMGIFALNMVPVPPFSIQGVIAGALRVPALQYAIGSFLGMLPTVVGWSIFGEQVAGALEDSKGVSFLVIALVAIVMVVLTILVRRWFAKQSAAA